MEKERLLNSFKDIAMSVSNHYNRTRTAMAAQKAEAAKSVIYDIERLVSQSQSGGQQLTVADFASFLNQKAAECESQIKKTGA